MQIKISSITIEAKNEIRSNTSAVKKINFHLNNMD